MNEEWQVLLNRLRELWFVPVLVHAFGFIYVQGLFAPYDGNLFILQPYMQTTSTSYAMYVLNGIYVSFIVGMGFILAWLILTQLDSRRIGRLRASSMGRLLIVLIAAGAFYMIWVYIQMLFVEHTLTSGMWALGKLPALTFYVPFYVLFFVATSLVWRLSYSRYRASSRVMTYAFMTIPILCLAISFYFFGMHVQAIQITSIVKDGEKLYLATVSVSNQPAKTYIRMDVTTDYFIGYDRSTRSVVQIPREQITSIESFRIAQNGALFKYSDRPNLEGTDEQRAVQAMRQFYAAITSTGESLEQMEELTSIVKNPLRNQLGLAIAPTILQRYAQAGKLYGEGAESFFGMELSFPRLVMDGDKEVFDIFCENNLARMVGFVLIDCRKNVKSRQ